MWKLSLLLAAMLLTIIVAVPPAQAAGTLAGSVISNQAYVDYKDANGNAMTRVFSNTVTTTVSQVAGVAIIPPTASQTAKNGDVIHYLAQLFNTGNAPDTQTFTYATSGAWTPTSVRMFYDANNNHTLDAGDVLLTETAPGSKTYKTVDGAGLPVLVPVDDDYDIIIELTVPAANIALDNTADIITVTTKSDFDNTKTATQVDTTTVLAAVITAAKTHTPAGTPTLLQPGDVITYTITMTNSGSIDGTGVLVTDPLPAGLTYKAGTIKTGLTAGTLTAKTDAADNDGAKYDAATRSIITPDGATSTSVTANGGTFIVQFQATINAGVASGTQLTNQASVTYSAGASTVTIQTGGDTFLVTTLSGIDLTSATPPKSGNAGDVIVYPFTATNNGNATDKIDLAVTSTQGWTWAVWVDANGDGIASTAGGDYLLTDTNGDGKIDTSSLVQNATINLLAVATIPVGTANGTADVLSINGASVNDPTKTDIQNFTTTVKAPVMSMTKGLTAVQDPTSGAVCVPADPSNPGTSCTVVPGSVLTYTMTVTNSGSGNATSVIIADLIPTFTVYKSGSIKTGATIATLGARTDAIDGDGAEYNSGANTVIAPDGSTLTLGPSGTWVVQFQVTVK